MSTKAMRRPSNGFDRAAAQGHALAQYSLGMANALGKGLERNGRASIPWFQKAADQGMAEAQFKFGVMSIAFSGLLGTGTGDGLSPAVESLRKAADQDFGEAQFALGLIYLQGSPFANPDTNLVRDLCRDRTEWLTVCWKRTVRRAAIELWTSSLRSRRQDDIGCHRGR